MRRGVVLTALVGMVIVFFVCLTSVSRYSGVFAAITQATVSSGSTPDLEVAKKAQRINILKKEDSSTPAALSPAPTSESPPSPALPHLAWLMSFPNSGTSYTSRLVRTLTNSSTASNYATGNRDKNGCSRLIAPDLVDGPFWESNSYSRLAGQGEGAGEYLLTKTHCGSYCNGCGPSEYLHAAEEFAESCRVGKRSTLCRREGEKRLKIKPAKSYEVVRYEPGRVETAVHLVRNPFDNIVSRFNLKRQDLMKKPDWDGREFSKDEIGFRRWCRYVDAKFVEEENISRILSKRRHWLTQIPCHGDFVRYIMWHNLATWTQTELALPTLVLHYDTYFTDFNATVDRLANFLNITERRNKPEDFVIGKTYRDYFRQEEKKAVGELARNMSSPETWSYLRQYFT